MLIAHSTLPGYVSYRFPAEQKLYILLTSTLFIRRDIFRGTWFVESLCKVFMELASYMDLRDMLDETARMLSEYETEAGTKQSFGYEVNILNLHGKPFF